MVSPSNFLSAICPFYHEPPLSNVSFHTWTSQAHSAQPHFSSSHSEGVIFLKIYRTLPSLNPFSTQCALFKNSFVALLVTIISYITKEHICAWNPILCRDLADPHLIFGRNFCQPKKAWTLSICARGIASKIVKVSVINTFTIQHKFTIQTFNLVNDVNHASSYGFSETASILWTLFGNDFCLSHVALTGASACQAVLTVLLFLHRKNCLACKHIIMSLVLILKNCRLLTFHVIWQSHPLNVTETDDFCVEIFRDFVKIKPLFVRFNTFYSQIWFPKSIS